jgi:hypothetical protein
MEHSSTGVPVVKMSRPHTLPSESINWTMDPRLTRESGTGKVGMLVGVMLGLLDGFLLGLALDPVGAFDGVLLGLLDGFVLGLALEDEGMLDGVMLGLLDGFELVGGTGEPVAGTGTLVAAAGALVAGSGAFVDGTVGTVLGALVAGTGALVAGRGAFVASGAFVVGTVGVGSGVALNTSVSASWHTSFNVAALTLMVAVFTAFVQASITTRDDIMVHCPEGKRLSGSWITITKPLKAKLAVVRSNGMSPVLHITTVYVIGWRQLLLWELRVAQSLPSAN